MHREGVLVGARMGGMQDTEQEVSGGSGGQGTAIEASIKRKSHHRRRAGRNPQNDVPKMRARGQDLSLMGTVRSAVRLWLGHFAATQWSL